MVLLHCDILERRCPNCEKTEMLWEVIKEYGNRFTCLHCGYVLEDNSIIESGGKPFPHPDEELSPDEIIKAAKRRLQEYKSKHPV